MGLFSPLTSEQKFIHIQPLTGPGDWPSGILASGESNFADPTQLDSGRAFTTSSPLLNHSGLYFTENNALSNGPFSRDCSINDFSIFNPYVHYKPNPDAITNTNALDPVLPKFTIIVSGFYNLAVSGFNIYNTKYRPLS
jgi:hypothetical protein